MLFYDAAAAVRLDTILLRSICNITDSTERSVSLVE
jgi:hypothetical protein